MTNQPRKEGPLVGVVIGNYQIIRKLGEGGMGAVYLGEHTLLGRRAAIKVLLPALSRAAGYRRTASSTRRAR